MMTGPEVREAAEQLRSVLSDLDAERLACSAATRHRIEGALMALDAVQDAHDVTTTDGQPASSGD